MVQLHDAYNHVHQSQHKFRTNRHIEAATRKDGQIFQLQMDKLNQSSRIAELNCQLQVLTSELTQWQTWWEHSADHEAVLHELLTPHVPPKSRSAQQGSEFDAISMAVKTQECLDDNCVHPLPVQVTRTAQDFALGPVAAQEHDWRDHIVWTLPSSGSPKSSLECSKTAATQVHFLVGPVGSAQHPSGSGTGASSDQLCSGEPCTLDEAPCVIIGGPSGLESMPVYTREELTIVCDALVEPLAKAIHGLADVGNLFAGSAPVVEKFSLGGLLRDICSKVVPLTAVLEARQRTIDKIREDHRELYQQSQTLRSNAEHSRDHTSASE